MPVIEKRMITTAIGTFFILLVIEIAAYLILFKDIPSFLSKYGYYLFLLIIAVVINGTAIWHMKAFKRDFSCMTGMMLGMTIGMTTSFSLGIIVGAVNGMFIGAVVGLILGMIVGAWVGYCCGVMGVMEGMMAGLMGGTMGPMIPLMALQYAPYISGIVLFCIVLILMGFVYIIYKEEAALEEKSRYEGYSFILFALVCSLITLIITLIMVYGPKSLLTFG